MICGAQIVQLVLKSVFPFKIVEEWGFLLMVKAGLPNYYLPSTSNASSNICIVFAWTSTCIRQMLQVSVSNKIKANREWPTGKIETHWPDKFLMDAWTLPNHYAYVAVMAQLVVWDLLICIVLNIIELPMVRR